MTTTKVTMETKDFVLDHNGKPKIFADDLDNFYVEVLATGEHVNMDTGELRPTPYITHTGRTMVSSQPMAIALLTKKPETIEETVSRLLSHSMMANYLIGEESLDEADNFDIDDDVPDPVTKYEAFLSTQVDQVDAVQRGIVTGPTQEESYKTRSLLEKARDRYETYKKAKATPPAGDSKEPQPNAAGAATT